MAFVALYDACVLYPNALRDLLIRVANAGLVRARWTERILDECFRAIQKSRPDLTAERLVRTRELMNQAVRDCLVDGYEPLIEGLTLPDPNDRHVLAAAIHCHAQTIVTINLKDFPDDALRAFGMEAQHPDDFLLCQIDLNEGLMLRILEEQRRALTRKPKSTEELLDGLQTNGLVRTVARYRELMT